MFNSKCEFDMHCHGEPQIKCDICTFSSCSSILTPDASTDRTVHLIAREKVQVGKDQEKAQSEKDSHSKNRGGKKPN